MEEVFDGVRHWRYAGYYWLHDRVTGSPYDYDAWIADIDGERLRIDIPWYHAEDLYRTGTLGIYLVSKTEEAIELRGAE